jgi:periplasmic protein TonB
MDTVSHVLAARTRDEAGLNRMFLASVAVHIVFLVVVVLLPSEWLGPSRPAEPESVMTISLGGPVGPRDGGMTPMGGRPVQEVQPVEARPQREAVRPPAAVTPQMVEPRPQAPPKKTPPPVKKAPTQARGTTPTRGEQVQTGSAIAETGGRGQGFGLTSGGGGTGAQLDVGDFCCPDYLATMQQFIQRNWSSKQQVAGTTVMTFVIERDGTLTGITTRRSSGFAALDLTAQRALVLTRQLPPLPAEFTEPSLTVHLSFNYER